VLKISAALFLWAKNEKNYEVKELAKITKNDYEKRRDVEIGRNNKYINNTDIR
jgi:hypothetical protein